PPRSAPAGPCWADRHGSSTSRGYGTKWQSFRTWYLREMQRLDVSRAGLCGARLPGAPLTDDSVCAREGRIEPGIVVDHGDPVTGPHDPTFFEPKALQLLCHRCHNAKRQREGRAYTRAGRFLLPDRALVRNEFARIGEGTPSEGGGKL